MTEETRRAVLRRIGGVVGLAGIAGAAGCLESGDSEPRDGSSGVDTSGSSTASTQSSETPTAPATFVAATYSDALVGIEPSEGATRWTSPMAVSRAVPPAADAGMVVAAGGDGDVIGLSGETGEREWSASLPATVDTLAADHGVAVAVTSETVTAYDVADGTQQWQRTVENTVEMRPAVYDSVVALPLSNGDVHALETDSGDRAWHVSAVSGLEVPLATGAGSLYAIDSSRVVTLDPESGDEHWSVSTQAPVDGPAVATDDAVFVPTVARTDVSTPTPEGTPMPTDVMSVEYEISTVALAAEDGSELWRTERTYEIDNYTDDRPSPSLAAAADRVFVVDLDAMYAYDAGSGERRWSTSMDGDHPTVAGGVVSTGVGGVDFTEGTVTWLSADADVDPVVPPAAIGPAT